MGFKGGARCGARYGVIALLAAAATLTAFGGGDLSPKKSEALCRRFIETHLMTPEGGVYTSAKVRNYLLFHTTRLEDLQLSGLLAESTGLLMRYAVQAGDKDLFDKQLELTKKSFTGQIGLFFWKISYDGELTANSTASVDDLRIVGACLEAYEKWQVDDYLDFATQIAFNIRRYETRDGQLRDFINWRDWGKRTVATTVQLSYIDLITIEKIAAHDPEWSELLRKNFELLRDGQMDNGLFHEGYDFEAQAYFGTRQNTINQLYCGLFLASTPGDSHELLKFFRERWKEDGMIYAEYDASTGEATQFFESTSVYALLARYALACGDMDFASQMTRRLMAFQNTWRFSPMYGSFCDDEIYSFDNLEALLTLRLYLSRQAAPAAGTPN